jgi:hypothetical protein
MKYRCYRTSESTRMQRWPCFESTISLREIRSVEGGDRDLGALDETR